MYEILTLDTPGLGDRSYLVHDGRVAVVIDPQRDVDRVLHVLAERQLTLTHVLETHIHNDYVSGGPALCHATGAAYVVNQLDPVQTEFVGVRDGDVLEVGGHLRFRVLATPGHTFTHLAFALEADGETRAVFTGGSLLYGSTGRPDLLGADYAETLARHQFASAHRLVDELPSSSAVFPTHGFGSFCSATQSEGLSSTLDEERRANPVLTLDEDTYVKELLAGLDAFPAYYAHMGPANLEGASAPDFTPPALADADEIRQRLERGEWVVDLRHRRAFAHAHVEGTISIGLDGSFATYLGWLIPWGTPLTVVGGSAEDVAAAQRELVRIGIDRIEATVHGDPSEWAPETVSTTRVEFAELTRRPEGAVVLDVRRRLEWEKGHLPGSVHIPLHELAGRMDEIPEGVVWVHCQSGYRSSIAASLLARAGRDVVHVDGDFSLL